MGSPYFRLGVIGLVALGLAAEPESIRQALAQIEDFPGVTGPITYRGRGGDPRRNGVIVRLEEDGPRLFKVASQEP